MQVTPLRFVSSGGPPSPLAPPETPSDRYSDFDEEGADRHRVSYELAHNLARSAGLGFESGARIGQSLQLATALTGTSAGPWAGGVALLGGSIDVARGSSRAQQAAINRDRIGTVQGNLQVAQGVATWMSAAASLSGAPPELAQIAATGALASVVGRALVEGERSSTPIDSPPQPESRFFEHSYALSKALGDTATSFGGLGAGWNNVSGLLSGAAPGGFWQGLGLVGSSYTLLQSAAQVSRSASNRHLNDTVAGSLGLVQGAASLAVSAGVGGRLLPGVAIGAFMLKQVVPLLSLKNKMSGPGDDPQQDPMRKRLQENWGYAWSGPVDPEDGDDEGSQTS